MPRVIRILLATDLLLVAVEHLLPSKTKNVLPLGGSEFIQLAVLLVLGVVVQELLSSRRGRKQVEGVGSNNDLRHGEHPVRCSRIVRATEI
jgi:hypothetical protein